MTILRTISGLAMAAVLLHAVGTAEAASKRPVLVELYTSQGCSSCPPADALLGQLAQRKDVLALSLPITYWDMLGWKDTLASDANTRRQKAYADAMGRGGIYTPQMIIDGMSDVVGSREPAVEEVIAARTADMHAVNVTLSASPQEIHVAVGAGSDHGEGATVWLFHVLSRATVAIHAGENEGRSITYRNVVRDVKAIGVWKGQPIALDLPRNQITTAPHDSVAVVVQQSGYGRVLGAAFLGRPDYMP
jgi:hypothetical protein